MSCSEAAILYIHGFNSSPYSFKARLLANALNLMGCTERWRAPALHHHPRQAIQQLEACIAELGRPLLVGSSLGGYYATHLAERHGLEALLINPAVNPHHWDLSAYLGPQVNYHTGAHWDFTQDHIQALAELEITELQDVSRYHIWLQTGDEVLNYRQAEAFYQACKLMIEEGGDHQFQGFAQRLPAVLALAGFADHLWRDADFSDL